MPKVLVTALIAAAVAAPVLASAATVDATLVPDGTYTVKVEKVQDSKHLTVLMDNGVETILIAQGSADFSRVQANQTIKISLIKGKVPVYAIQ